DAVDFAVLSALATVAERRLLVPLPFGNDVANVVVGQADHHAFRTGQLLVDGGLDTCVRKIRAWVRRVLHFVQYQLGIDFAGNGRDAELPELQPGDFGLEAKPLLEFLGVGPLTPPPLPPGETA